MPTKYVVPYMTHYGAMVPNWLLARREVSPGAKLCWARLAAYAGRRGVCWPTQAQVADALAVGDRQVRRYISELVAVGLLEETQRGLSESNLYRFLYHPWMDAGRRDTAPEPGDPDPDAGAGDDSHESGPERGLDTNDRTSRTVTRRGQKRPPGVDRSDHPDRTDTPSLSTSLNHSQNQQQNQPAAPAGAAAGAARGEEKTADAPLPIPSDAALFGGDRLPTPGPDKGNPDPAVAGALLRGLGVGDATADALAKAHPYGAVKAAVDKARKCANGNAPGYVVHLLRSGVQVQDQVAPAGQDQGTFDREAYQRWVDAQRASRRDAGKTAAQYVQQDEDAVRGLDDPTLARLRTMACDAHPDQALVNRMRWREKDPRGNPALAGMCLAKLAPHEVREAAARGAKLRESNLVGA